MKRLFDIIFSIAGSIILFPIIIITALFVAIFLGRPVIFGQLRPGLNGNEFVMYKFRTMTEKRYDNGDLLPDAERLTKFGIFLRKYSLDELPGLWNIIKGDMSIVGPRPLLMDYLPLYSKEQKRRHNVRPGITGWAQINGRNAISWEKKFELDVWYVDNRNILLDIKIIFLTIAKVATGANVNHEDHATMVKFTGSKNS